MKVREVALKFTRRIPLVEKVCPVCGSTFEGPVQSMYCSEPCRRRADWAKHGKERNARRKATKEQQS